MNDLNSIEKYFEGGMTSEEMKSFEEQVSRDPELKREFEFQQEIIETVQQVRKAELKAMLDSVPPPTGLIVSTTTKIISTAAIVGGIGIGVYLTSGEEAPVKDEIINTEHLEMTPKAIDESIEEDVGPTTETVPAPPKDEKQKPAATPTPVSPDVIEAFEDEEETDSIEMPDHDLFKTTTSSSTNLNVEVISDPNFTFHYKFENDRLFLYADLSAEPYEILEIKDDESGGIFLYFLGKFYMLNRSSIEITPLQEITDSDSITKLNHLKNDE